MSTEIVSEVVSTNSLDHHIFPEVSKEESTEQSLKIQTSEAEVSNTHSEQPYMVSETAISSVEISHKSFQDANLPTHAHTQDSPIAQSFQSQTPEYPNEQFAQAQVHESSVGVQCSPVQRVSPTMSPREVQQSEEFDDQPAKKTKRRGTAWTDDQTDFLLEVWARHTDSSGNEEYSITNAPIYRIISRSMGELGYLDKTSDQCKCRIHTLKRAYKLTKAEIDARAQNITFCKHYEKLKIIMGDEPTTTPKQLAEILAERRHAKKLSGSSSDAKPKKFKPSPESKLKRALLLDTTSKDSTPPKQPYKAVSPIPTAPKVPPLPAVSSLWNHQAYTYPTTVTPPTQNQNIPYSEIQYSSPVNTQNLSYHSTPENSVSPNTSYDINHNTSVVVKQEKLEDGYPTYQPYLQKTNEPVSQTKEEIERMRLDLEIKKIEMERNRLEMEERQRREDRDHQYRMMQLLLMGLGHNPAVGSAGQGAEAEEAHQPELSRALEGGLVPGGAQSANEKGLSFSEI